MEQAIPGHNLSAAQFAKLFDHTNLKASATDADFQKLCQEAADYGFRMVAINSCQTKLCKLYLKGTDVHVGAAISFPLGQTTLPVKLAETADAIENGADEIDYVINIGQLKMGNTAYIQEEMAAIVDICRKHGVISKVIFENCYLTKEEIKTAALIAKEVRPDFIKTSTGFGPGGATVEDVRLMKETVGDQVKVKAAGGVRDLETCLAMVAAGAERIGSSSSVALTEAYKEYLNK